MIQIGRAPSKRSVPRSSKLQVESITQQVLFDLVSNDEGLQATIKKSHSRQKTSIHKDLGVQKNMVYAGIRKQFCEAGVLCFEEDSCRE